MNIFDTIISSSMLVLVTILIRTFLINKLPKVVFVILWSITGIRMLIPFSIPSPVSFFNLFNSSSNLANVETTTSQNSLLAVWIVGLLVISVFFVMSYTQHIVKLKKAVLYRSSLVDSWSNSIQGKKPQIVVSDAVDTPMTYGIFNPVIILPESVKYLDEESLSYILWHEYTHIRHFDSALKLMFTVILCLYWYNPFAWVMYIFFNRDIELYCDEAVLKITKGKKQDYANLLVRMMEYRIKDMPYFASFSRLAMKERIRTIMKNSKKPVIIIIVSVAIVACCTIAFATSNNANAVTSSDAVTNYPDDVEVVYQSDFIDTDTGEIIPPDELSQHENAAQAVGAVGPPISEVETVSE